MSCNNINWLPLINNYFCIIDSIPHCYTENALKLNTGQESRNVVLFLCIIQN